MIKWQWKTFSELTAQTLYDILQLREAVFQIEQQSLYVDCDNLDQLSEHLLGYQSDKLVAYLRIFKQEKNLHIGRIVTAKAARGKGLGRELIDECLKHIKEKHPNLTVEMSAQCYLEKFYGNFGFVTTGEPFDDAGVPHIRMILKNH